MSLTWNSEYIVVYQALPVNIIVCQGTGISSKSHLPSHCRLVHLRAKVSWPALSVCMLVKLVRFNHNLFTQNNTKTFDSLQGALNLVLAGDTTSLARDNTVQAANVPCIYVPCIYVYLEKILTALFWFP